MQCLPRHSILTLPPLSSARGPFTLKEGQFSRLALPNNIRSKRSGAFGAKPARCTVPHMLD